MPDDLTTRINALPIEFEAAREALDLFVLWATNQEAKRDGWEVRQARRTIDELLDALKVRDEMLAALIDAHYGGSYHHIGDGDGLTDEEAAAIRTYAKAERGA